MLSLPIIEAELVNDTHIVLAPILLGDGIRLFSRQDAGPVDLQLVGVSLPGQITNLQFHVPPK